MMRRIVGPAMVGGTLAVLVPIGANAASLVHDVGSRAGLAIHFVGYTLAPIVFGVIAVVLGLAGKSLF